MEDFREFRAISFTECKREKGPSSTTERERQEKDKSGVGGGGGRQLATREERVSEYREFFPVMSVRFQTDNNNDEGRERARETCENGLR